MKKLPTTKLIPDRRHKGDDKSRQFPTRLRVTSGSTQWFIPIPGFSFTIKEWEKMHGEKPGDELKNKLIQLNAEEGKAIAIIGKLKHQFTIDAFRKKWSNDEGGQLLKDYFNRYIKELRRNDQIKTARVYESAKVSFEKFRPGLLLSDVNESVLNDHQRWMTGAKEEKAGSSKNSVSIYARCVRRLWNVAIDSYKDLKREDYPFGRDKYKIPKSPTKKSPITWEDLEKLINYKTKDPRELEARDMWLFSYYCLGQNPTDICRMTWDYIDTDANTITFPYRKKTENTDPDQKPKIIFIHEDIQAILDAWANKTALHPKDYIFKVLKRGMKENEIVPLIEAFNRRMNSGLADIQEELKLKSKLTMGNARHTMANVMRKKGASKKRIGEALGHSNEKTTDIYLESLESKVFTEEQELLRVKPTPTSGRNRFVEEGNTFVLVKKAPKQKKKK
jgi:integrase/recombinase XerD